MKLLPALALALLPLALSVPAGAAAGDAGLLACRANTDAAARLACYDALPVSPAPVVAAPTAPAAPAASRFGLEARSDPTVPDSVQSRIAGRFEGWQSATRFKLENGQVWQIADGSRRTYNLDSPKVTVRRGMLGAFYLDVEGVNMSPQVRRVQ